MNIGATLYGNSIQAWLLAIGVLVAVYLALVAVLRLVVKRVGALAARTATSPSRC